MSDFLYDQQQMPQYLGSTGAQETRGSIGQYTPPSSQPLQQDIRGLMGQLGSDQLMAGAREYMGSVMGGAGVNPYESQAFQDYRGATMGQTRENLQGLSSTLGGSGLLRGSGSERLAGDVIGQGQRQLGEQSFAAQQAGLGRQAQIGMYAPQMAMQQYGANLQGLGAIGQLGQQDISNMFQKYGLQMGADQMINQMYGVPERGGGALDIIGGLGGAAMGVGLGLGPLGFGLF